MIRSMQMGNEMLVMTWQERDGKVTLGDMTIVPLVIYKNIKNGFRYEEIL